MVEEVGLHGHRHHLRLLHLQEVAILQDVAIAVIQVDVADGNLKG